MSHSRTYIRIMNSPQWRMVRARKLQEHPYCEECLREGIVTPAQCVHHLTEIESQRTEAAMWSVGLALNNLESLCYAHHRKAHTGYHTRDAHRQRTADRLASWIAAQEGKADDTLS